MCESLDERPLGKQTMAPGMSGAKNYYRWIISEFVPYLGNNILDIGGGNGSHLEPFLSTNFHVTSIDMSESSVHLMQIRFSHYPAFRALHGNFESKSFQYHMVTYKFNTILCLNVLEHIENDNEALNGMHLILQSSHGHLLLQVPAHKWLYGSLDRQAGHFRRYSSADLRQKLNKAGFKIIQLFYFNTFGVIPWLINARLLSETITSRRVDTQIRLFDRYLVPFQRWIESRVKFPFGQSLIAVSRVE